MALLLIVVAPQAGAITITALPSASEIGLGESFSVTITGDFTSDPTLGGGLDVEWDTAVLDLLAWSPIDWGGDAFFYRPGDVDQVTGAVDGFAAGSFDGVGTTVTMAELEFLVRPDASPGAITTLVLSDDADGVAGPFVSAVTFTAQAPEFVSVGIRVVPSPIALVLMLSAMGAIGVASRRRDALFGGSHALRR